MSRRTLGRLVSLTASLRIEAGAVMEKVSLVALLFLFSAFAWAGSNPDPAEYNVSIHVTASHMVPEGGTVYQKMEVLIDGKKYELQSEAPADRLLSLSDYKAKIVRDDHKVAYESFKVYEVLFSDQKTRRFIVVGQTE